MALNKRYLCTYLRIVNRAQDHSRNPFAIRQFDPVKLEAEHRDTWGCGVREFDHNVGWAKIAKRATAHQGDLFEEYVNHLEHHLRKMLGEWPLPNGGK